MTEFQNTATSAQTQPHPRTHATLRREATRDPIFLLQERVAVWAEAGAGPEYDHDAEAFVNEEGGELSTAEAIDAGAGSWVWQTITVFLTRSEGEEWATARSYRYEHGWKVYCVPAEGDLCNALAAVTQDGRYL